MNAPSAPPRVLLERNAHQRASSETEKGSKSWIAVGAGGGAAFGATVAGPVGAVVGAGIGAVAGGVRVATGKHLLQHWEELTGSDRERILGMVAAGVSASSSAPGPNAPSAPPASSADPSQALAGSGNARSSGAKPQALNVEDLKKIKDSEAGDEPQCKVCLSNKVVVALQPCGHACLCATCCVSVLQSAGQWQVAGSPAGKCPVCRGEIQDVLRVYL
eukprot:gnl/MRDRNA2_/MRDRNA2_106257_c0_seq1.p1 gnl/MRDRNA2_/MRDRNA2_106257_c0~~gnl/MRDRNA2_/MRDRNA2_106257_c0_seq1.p1  ORF type:complete len:218 (+),score=51.74 gnl/MRDRNA2_/MRDRNA2_106257_c0_seq1:70-723(+)